MNREENIFKIYLPLFTALILILKFYNPHIPRIYSGIY